MSGRRRPSSERLVTHGTRVALSATVAALVLQPLLAAPAVAAGPVTPTPTVPLPVAADVVPGYQGQRSCDPAAKPGVEAYARMVLQTYRTGHNGGIVRGCGIGATSEHKEGRAFDYMLSVNVPAEKAAGDALTGWLTGPDEHGVVGGHARRLGVMYVIWNRRIWSTYAMGSGWKAYSGASAHTDHVHTSFSWDGAMKRTSWWTSRATTADDTGPCRVYAGQPAPVYTARHLAPCPTALPAAPTSSYAIVWPGQSGSAVKVAQARLGLNADGVFGAGTRTRLMGWQKSSTVPVTGVLDKPTWARLAPGSVTTPVTPPPSVPTPPTPTPTTPTPATPAPVPAALTTSLTPYRGLVLSRGSRGAAVTALQRALRIASDGAFGSGTAAAVAAVQTRSRLAATGVVDLATWAAVERSAYPLLAYRTTRLQRGSTGAAVVALQRALRTVADGQFGSGTRAAVVAAQVRARLAGTGVVDVATWRAVEARAYPLGAPVAVVTTPTTPVVAPPAPARPAVAPATSVSAYKATTLRQGMHGPAVAALQRALATTADGAFGAGTARWVKAFQTARHLPVTGVVDRRTWDAAELVAHPLLAQRATVVRLGSRGTAVVALQKALRLPADGAFGARTQAAVKAAQVKGHLAANGVVATSTWVVVERLAYPLGVKRW